MLLNSGARYGRPLDARKNDIWPIRVFALGTRAREHPIVELSVRAVLFPGPRFGGENWIVRLASPLMPGNFDVARTNRKRDPFFLKEAIDGRYFRDY